jgi:hypothetical protein
MKQLCATPDCTKRPVKGSRFCKADQAVLAGVREALDKEIKQKGMYYRRLKPGMVPTCCYPGCENERNGLIDPVKFYCDDCISLGRDPSDR